VIALWALMTIWVATGEQLMLALSQRIWIVVNYNQVFREEMKILFNSVQSGVWSLTVLQVHVVANSKAVYLSGH
jgi:hypothetical protein